MYIKPALSWIDIRGIFCFGHIVVTLLGSWIYYSTSKMWQHDQLLDKHMLGILTYKWKIGGFHSMLKHRAELKISIHPWNKICLYMFLNKVNQANSLTFKTIERALKTYKFQTSMSLCKYPLSVRSGFFNDIKCYTQFSTPGSVWLTLSACWWDGIGGIQVACWSG